MRRAPSSCCSPLGLLAAGCGGSSNDSAGTSTERRTATTDRDRGGRADGCSDVTVPEAREDGGATAAEGAPRSREDLQARLQDQLRLVHGHARPGQGAGHGGLARLAREGRVLRQHDLPPHRARLRDPGRRSDAVRNAAGPGYQTVDPPPADASYDQGRRRDGEDGRRGARDDREPVLRRQRRRYAARFRRTTRSSATSRAGWTPSSASAASAIPTTRAGRRPALS